MAIKHWDAEPAGQIGSSGFAGLGLLEFEGGKVLCMELVMMKMRVVTLTQETCSCSIRKLPLRFWTKGLRS